MRKRYIAAVILLGLPLFLYGAVQIDWLVHPDHKAKADADYRSSLQASNAAYNDQREKERIDAEVSAERAKQEQRLKDDDLQIGDQGYIHSGTVCYATIDDYKAGRGLAIKVPAEIMVYDNQIIDDKLLNEVRLLARDAHGKRVIVDHVDVSATKD